MRMRRKGDGLPEVKKYFVDKSKPGEWMFPDNIWTDKSAEEIIQSSVQAKLLDFLPQEIPYSLIVEIEYFHINEQGVINTVVLVKTPSIRLSKLIAGGGYGKLRQIIQSVQEDLQNAFKNFGIHRNKLTSSGPESESEMVAIQPYNKASDGSIAAETKEKGGFGNR
ncbi:hypothetical protein HUJ05_010275 [Dendroctonus ponderosae]|nr:hypothetical protein HUJ05_010275 [Dendroctonus ponderosae]